MRTIMFHNTAQSGAIAANRDQLREMIRLSGRPEILFLKARNSALSKVEVVLNSNQYNIATN
jgi:hypothetical protein